MQKYFKGDTNISLTDLLTWGTWRGLWWPWRRRWWGWWWAWRCRGRCRGSGCRWRRTWARTRTGPARWPGPGTRRCGPPRSDPRTRCNIGDLLVRYHDPWPIIALIVLPEQWPCEGVFRILKWNQNMTWKHFTISKCTDEAFFKQLHSVFQNMHNMVHWYGTKMGQKFLSLKYCRAKV